ncbi:unnamed protein product, partial [Amoebophrya sp. A25]
FLWEWACDDDTCGGNVLENASPEPRSLSQGRRAASNLTQLMLGTTGRPASTRERRRKSQYLYGRYRGDAFAVTFKNFRGCTLNYFQYLVAIIGHLITGLRIANPWSDPTAWVSFLVPATPYGWGGAILASPGRARFV